LSLPIPPETLGEGKPFPMLEGLIQAFSEEVKNDPNNKWQVYSHYKITSKLCGKLPDLFFIQLKRFQAPEQEEIEDYAKKIGRPPTREEFIKMMKKIEVPVVMNGETVDLKDLLSPELQKGNASTKYRLRSFIRHTGNLSSGHYWACTRKGDQWWHVEDDSSVERIKLKTLKKERDNAYIYCFERIQEAHYTNASSS